MAKKKEAVTFVKCYTCGVDLDPAKAEKLGEEYLCLDQDACEKRTPVKPVLSPEAAFAAANAKKVKAPKAAKIPAKPIRYCLLDYTPVAGERPPARQVAVILDTIRRQANPETGYVLKSVLLEALTLANDPAAVPSLEDHTHNLRAVQPAAAILAHYQRKLIDGGRIELDK